MDRNRSMGGFYVPADRPQAVLVSNTIPLVVIRLMSLRFQT